MNSRTIMVKRKKNGADSVGAVFGEVLRIKREDTGMTQEEAAKLIHVERSLITKFENGERVPDAAHVDNLDLKLGGRGELIRLHRRIDQGSCKFRSCADGWGSSRLGCIAGQARTS